MSKESSHWLNNNTLIGFTDKRGNAWHYRAADQGAEANHYTGAVPVADVSRRLFGWEAVSLPVFVRVPCEIGECDGIGDDGQPYRSVPLPDRQAIARSDTHDVFEIFKSGYQTHQYQEWLINRVSNLLGDTLEIGSAGLLKRGGVAWVSIEQPEAITTPEGVEYRPNLLAATSHDGSLSTTYAPVITNVVCDNTLAAGLAEKTDKVKVRHSRYSHLRVDEARDVLGILDRSSEAFEAEVRELTRTEVTDHQWRLFLDSLAPIPETPGRGATMAERKQETLRRLWNHDQRVSPWKGTAYGVLQAVNTYEHHEANAKGASRAERNALRAVNGDAAKSDQATVDLLQKVLVSA